MPNNNTPNNKKPDSKLGSLEWKIGSIIMSLFNSKRGFFVNNGLIWIFILSLSGGWFNTLTKIPHAVEKIEKMKNNCFTFTDLKNLIAYCNNEKISLEQLTAMDIAAIMERWPRHEHN